MHKATQLGAAALGFPLESGVAASFPSKSLTTSQPFGRQEETEAFPTLEALPRSPSSKAQTSGFQGDLGSPGCGGLHGHLEQGRAGSPIRWLEEPGQGSSPTYLSRWRTSANPSEPREPGGIPSGSHQQGRTLRLTEQEHLPEATLVATESSQEPMTFRPNFSLDLAWAPKRGVTF